MKNSFVNISEVNRQCLPALARKMILKRFPALVAIQVFSSRYYSLQSDGWAHLMRCYRVHMDQILVHHGKPGQWSRVLRSYSWWDWPVSLKDPLSLAWSPWSEASDHCISQWWCAVIHRSTPPLWYIPRNWDTDQMWWVSAFSENYWDQKYRKIK